MRTFHHIALLVVLLAGLSSCRTEVILDLDDAPRRLVVEALMTPDSTQTFTVSQSGGFYERDLFPVQSANLTLTGPTSGILPLSYEAGGRYQLQGYVPQSGDQHILSVEVDGITYVAQATFPPAVSLLDAELMIDFANTEISGFSVKVADPPGMPNYYRVKAAINGVRPPVLYHLFSDEDNADGDTLSPIFFLGSNLNPGDTVDLELMSLDQGAYQYYKEVSKAIIATNTSNSPFNPMGNFSNGALGYFGGAVSDTMRLIIP